MCSAQNWSAISTRSSSASAWAKASGCAFPVKICPKSLEALAFIEKIHTEPLHADPGRRACRRDRLRQHRYRCRDPGPPARRGEVVVIYRRGEADMSAYAFEYDLAKRDGADFWFHHAPLEVLADNGHVAGLRLVAHR